MSDGIQLIIRPDGVAERYDDTYDLTIQRTTSQDQENELLGKIKVGAFYRHFKGGLYMVTGIARHTESMEMLVIYEDVEYCGKNWARPIEMFCDMVDGVPRFTEVDNGRMDL